MLKISLNQKSMPCFCPKLHSFQHIEHIEHSKYIIRQKPASQQQLKITEIYFFMKPKTGKKVKQVQIIDYNKTNLILVLTLGVQGLPIKGSGNNFSIFSPLKQMNTQ